MDGWLATVGVPLFVSHRRLARRKTLPKARTEWALDSGGFSELSLFGGWRTTPEEYTAAVIRYDTQIGQLSWAAQQDMMTEPEMTARTGLSLEEHQRRTVANFVELQRLWTQMADKRSESPWDPYSRARHPTITYGAGICSETAVSICRSASSSVSDPYAGVNTQTRSATSSTPYWTAIRASPYICSVSRLSEWPNTVTNQPAATHSPGHSTPERTHHCQGAPTPAVPTACSGPCGGAGTSSAEAAPNTANPATVGLPAAAIVTKCGHDKPRPPEF
uniref:DeoxyPurine in DNA protein A domain-containing protein n=1 Tax=Mycolicibacterium sp. CBMA 213 TaxID=1968788 RepID=A0A343VRU3_9MYCO|nr:hypothetical protein B5P44_p00355 [Mycolicibacterium sp. CBMA 213]